MAFRRLPAPVLLFSGRPEKQAFHPGLQKAIRPLGEGHVGMRRFSLELGRWVGWGTRCMIPVPGFAGSRIASGAISNTIRVVGVLLDAVGVFGGHVSRQTTRDCSGRVCRSPVRLNASPSGDNPFPCTAMSHWSQGLPSAPPRLSSGVSNRLRRIIRYHNATKSLAS